MVPGQVFDNRYRIIRLLGAGGMGAVYQAWDDHLSLAVAIKLVRAELTADPASVSDIERRFRRELLFARQVTHKHVVRIHDLGEVDGVIYLTMPFVPGRDLAKSLQRDGRWPVARALVIYRQVVAGLVAAHQAGVVHRDLKPANIMIDEQGQAQIMDFGIARSAEPGSTISGGLVGTVHYMAPEQLHGAQAEARSDIYSLGLVFYEMLAGHEAIGTANTSLGALVTLRQQRPASLRSFGLPVPAALDELVLRCLDPDPARRYQSARDLEMALSQLDSFGHPLLSASAAGVPPTEARAARWQTAWVASAALVAIVLLGAAGWLAIRPGPAATTSMHAPVSVLIAEFENHSGDPVFDGVVEQALGVSLESAPFVTAYPRREAIRVAREVRSGAKIDESVARLVALREGIQVVVSGTITRSNGRYELTAKAVDAAKGDVMVTATAAAAGKDQVLDAVGRLAATVRRGLGDATPESTQTAAAETFTAASLEAAHAYAAGQNAFYAGKTEDAIRFYGEATTLDPGLGRAYAGLASSYLNKGQRDEADRYYQLALARLDRMTERERFRTRATYYLFAGNAQKALEESTQLVKAYPSDSAALINLALAAFYTRDMSRALELERQVMAIYPKSVIGRSNFALYAMYAGDFTTAEREAGLALQLNPAYFKAVIATALAQLAQGRRDEAIASYRKLADLSASGASYASAGQADVAFYDGRPAEAAAALDQGIARDIEARSLRGAGAAIKQVMLASARFAMGRQADAARALDAALAWSHEPPVLFLAGHLDIDLGRRDKALALAAELEQSVEADPSAYGLLLRGEAALAGNDPRAAFDLFKRAQTHADTWFGRFDLGRANLKLERFAEASSEFEVCLKRRGEVTALFLDEVPTYRFLPPVYYYLGQVKEGLKSPVAVDSYRTFLAMKDKADAAADPLVQDARRRVANR